MITASELGMLCAGHRVKSAAGWPTPLIGGGLSAGPPYNAPHVPPPPKPKSTLPAHPDLPSRAALLKTDTAFRNIEYPPAGKEPDFLQPPKQPKFDYLNPPGDNTRTKISPRNFVEPIYAKYPGGLDQAIQDSQRWQNEARLAGLPTWTPEGLSKEVPVYIGKYVGARETPATPNAPNSFVSDPDVGGYFSPRSGSKYVAMNFPLFNRFSNGPARYASTLGHELTHATHHQHAETDKWPSRVSVFPPNFMEEKDQKYYGRPSEFAARISEARRDWLQHNPGKRISTVQEGSNVLDDIYAATTAKPVKFIVQRSKYPTMTREGKSYQGLNSELETLADWEEKIPKGAPADLPSRAALLKSKAPVPPYVQHAKEEIDRLSKLIGRDVLHQDEITVEPRKLPYRLDFPLEKIMADPKLKQKAIIQILSSVVQNKQRQAPGTNV